MAQAAAEEAQATFADEMAELERTVRELESGRLDLDAALARFEKGVALTRRLRARLDAAEGRIEELLSDGSARSLDVA